MVYNKECETTEVLDCHDEYRDECKTVYTETCETTYKEKVRIFNFLHFGLFLGLYNNK